MLWKTEMVFRFEKIGANDQVGTFFELGCFLKSSCEDQEPNLKEYFSLLYTRDKPPGSQKDS